MSISMYEKAVEAGFEDAQKFLADYYIKTKAYAKAGALYKKLNINGHFNTIAYAYYREMPEELIAHAKSKLPQWMLDLNDEFEEYCAGIERN